MAVAFPVNKLVLDQSSQQIFIKIPLATQVQPKSFLLENPRRLVVDIPQGRWANPPLPTFSDKGVHAIRHSENKQRLRVVFDLAQSWHLVASKVEEGGFSITLKPKDTRALELPKVETKNKQDKVKKQFVKHDLKPIVVVIDPGHGGKDPGAIGRGKKREKDIVLSIAKQVAREINQVFGYKAVLTRDADYYIPLRERLNIARRHNADMFISIHADAYKNRHAHGASVFALSERGATSEAARWLAEKENSSELMSGVKLDDKGSVLKSVLLDLSQTATTGAGLEIGSEVLHELKKVTSLHKGRVEQAAFVVLKSPDIPSLLIETGFVSNKNELANLVSPVFQKKLASSIANGVTQYFNRRPVRGSILEASLHGGVKHVVQSGDTLSRIANKYRVSLSQLKKSNHLESERLLVGQVLLIPS